MFARCDQVFADEARDRLTRTVTQTITDQVWVTTSGLLQPAALDRAADDVSGPTGCCSRSTTRSAPNRKATDFLRSLPIPEADRLKLAHGNADRLLGLDAGPQLG